MTNQIETNDILTLGKAGRMVYLGEGFASLERFIPERGETGGLTNSGKGKFAVDAKFARVKLTDAQIAEWLAKKTVG